MMKIENAPDNQSEPNHTVLLIHGIRTRAENQSKIIKVLTNEKSIRVVPTSYKYFDVIRFILPLKKYRQVAIDRITLLIRDELQRKPEYISVIAHSFGTYIFSKILEQQSDLKFHRVILCGSIISESFPWDKYRHNLDMDKSNQWHLINDCGLIDRWPILALSSTWGYGASGRFGFGHGRVKDRFHSVGHSDFFNEQYIKKYWIKFLKSGEIIEGELDRNPAFWWESAITILKIKHIVISVLLAGLVYFSANGGLFDYKWGAEATGGVYESPVHKLDQPYQIVTTSDFRVLQFQIDTTKSAYRTLPNGLWFKEVSVLENREKTFTSYDFLAEPFPFKKSSGPVFNVTIENLSDKQQIITRVLYRVYDIDKFRGGSYGPLEPNVSYRNGIKWEVGDQLASFVPPFSLNAKKAGSFSLELYSLDEGVHLGWLMEVFFLDADGNAASTGLFSVSMQK